MPWNQQQLTDSRVYHKAQTQQMSMRVTIHFALGVLLHSKSSITPIHKVSCLFSLGVWVLASLSPHPLPPGLKNCTRQITTHGFVHSLIFKLFLANAEIRDCIGYIYIILISPMKTSNFSCSLAFVLLIFPLGLPGNNNDLPV